MLTPILENSDSFLHRVDVAIRIVKQRALSDDLYGAGREFTRLMASQSARSHACYGEVSFGADGCNEMPCQPARSPRSASKAILLFLICASLTISVWETADDHSWRAGRIEAVRMQPSYLPHFSTFGPLAPFGRRPSRSPDVRSYIKATPPPLPSSSSSNVCQRCSPTSRSSLRSRCSSSPLWSKVSRYSATHAQTSTAEESSSLFPPRMPASSPCRRSPWDGRACSLLGAPAGRRRAIALAATLSRRRDIATQAMVLSTSGAASEVVSSTECEDRTGADASLVRRCRWSFGKMEGGVFCERRHEQLAPVERTREGCDSPMYYAQYRRAASQPSIRVRLARVGCCHTARVYSLAPSPSLSLTPDLPASTLRDSPVCCAR